MSSSTVFTLTGWSAPGEHMTYGPQVFAGFDSARSTVRVLDSGPDWWFQSAPGRALRWKDPKNHAAGFWEIVTLTVAD